MRLPNNTHRIAIVGTTGSGKTQAGAWHLSRRNFSTQPHVIVDYKYDELLNDIDGAQEIDLKFTPKKPGLYIVHPMPHEGEAVENFLWKIWERERIGLYFDEGYMIGDSPAFRAILTQGRSKNIPAIILSQRPVWMSRFVFSESNFLQIFRLNDRRDQKTVTSFVPVDLSKRLPEYHSYYYDVGDDKVNVLTPVPEREYILAAFDAQLGIKRTYI